ncbi:MAG: hypothetical protein OFPII_05560 [Osedax symbiont Rs1]|nr:MAG: hypothetical protein OFPII_05560 [Osedax symbiont Rs1]
MKSDRQLNQSLNRGLLVAELLLIHQCLSLQELYVYSGFSKPALLRCLKTLIARNWVRKRDNDKRYIWIGMATSAEINHSEMIAKKSLPIIQQLSVNTGLAVDLALLSQRQLLTVIDSINRKRIDGINTYVAGHIPSLLMSALGRAFLYGCDRDRFQHYYSQVLKDGLLAEQNHVNSRRWKEEKARFALLGCSVRESDDYIPQTAYENSASMALAVPLYRHGRAIGAINLLWNDPLISTATVIARHLAELLSTADKLSVLLSIDH